jgi:hypothetical protein
MILDLELKVSMEIVEALGVASDFYFLLFALLCVALREGQCYISLYILVACFGFTGERVIVTSRSSISRSTYCFPFGSRALQSADFTVPVAAVESSRDRFYP